MGTIFLDSKNIQRGKIKYRIQKPNIFVVIFVFPFKVICSHTVGLICAAELKRISQSSVFESNCLVNVARCSLCTHHQYRNERVPCIRRGAIRAILLYVHAKEAHIYSVYLLKRKQSFGTIRERFRHLTRIHKSEGKGGRKERGGEKQNKKQKANY